MEIELVKFFKSHSGWFKNRKVSILKGEAEGAGIHKQQESEKGEKAKIGTKEIMVIF